MSSHSGAYCELMSDDACLCVVAEEVPCGFLRPIEAPPCTEARKRVTGACAADGSCTEGVCASVAACAAAPEKKEPAKTDDEGCSHVPLSGALGLGLLMLATRRR